MYIAFSPIESPIQGEEELTESQKAEREALQKEADDAGQRFLHGSVCMWLLWRILVSVLSP